MYGDGVVEIETGVPIPPAAGAKAKYPWREMDVGDSFFVPNRKASHMGGQIARARKITGFEYVSRTMDGGVRIWRTA